MSDILDYIREKLTAQPLTAETIQSAVLDARMKYAGDMVYIRHPKVRDFSGTVRAIPGKRPTVRR
jgi:hypothetical protein